MSLIESLFVLLKGGWPTFPCAQCGTEVNGEHCGAVEPDTGRVWCHSCAEVLP